MSGKTCRICEHPERALLDKLLEQGQIPPRALAKRIGLTTRKALTRHRDECVSKNRERIKED